MTESQKSYKTIKWVLRQHIKGNKQTLWTYKDNEFNNIVFASSKEYYYGGGINEFPIRMYHLYERNAHVSYRTDIGMVMDMKNTSCTFYEPIDH